MFLPTTNEQSERTWTSLVAQTVKRLPTMRETQVQSLGLEDPLEKEMATTPVFLPGESHGWRSLVGYSPWGHLLLMNNLKELKKAIPFTTALKRIKYLGNAYNQRGGGNCTLKTKLLMKEIKDLNKQRFHGHRLEQYY